MGSPIVGVLVEELPRGGSGVAREGAAGIVLFCSGVRGVSGVGFWGAWASAEAATPETMSAIKQARILGIGLSIVCRRWNGPAASCVA